jgi:hypothetical protein
MTDALLLPLPEPSPADDVLQAQLARMMGQAGATGADDFAMDAKAQLAKALVENAAALSDDYVKIEAYLYWAWGDELAAPFLQRMLDNRLRMNQGVAKHFVDAIRALASIDNMDAKLFGAFGKSKE